MDQIGDIILKLKIAELETQLALREIERVGLSRQIDDRNTDPDEKDRAILRRERTIVEWGQTMVELQELRERRGCEPELMPRASLN